MKRIIFTILLLPLLTFAQTDGELTIGSKTVSYDTTTEVNGGMLYYQGDDLVASTHGKVALVYQEGQAVLEAHDTNDDGVFDAFLTLDSEGAVTKMEGEGASVFTRPEVVEFADLRAYEEKESAAANEEDLVGSLDSITIPGYHNYLLYVFIALLISGGYWYYRKRKLG